MPNPSFGQRFAEGLGQQIIISRENAAFQADLENKQALAALRRQEVEANAAAMAERRRQQQVSREIGGFLSQAQASDAQEVMDPLKSAKAFNDAAAIAYSKGSPDLAVKLGAMADKKVQEAKEIAHTKKLEQQQSAEALSDAAYNFKAAPSPEGAQALVKAAIAAGENPTSIPIFGTLDFEKWSKAKLSAGMSSKEQRAAEEKQREFEATKDRLEREHEDREEDKRLSRQQVSIAQQGLAEYRKDMIDLKKQMADRKEKAPTKMSVSETNTVNAIVGSAAEAVRGLRVIGAMAPGQTAGAFAGMNTGGGIISSLQTVGGNKVTPESMQLYQTASAGLGLELGRVLTLGGGRGVNQAQIHEFQRMTQVNPGDTEFEAMFKLANAADIVRNRLSTLPDSQNPKVLKQQREAEEYLAKLPTPEEVIETALKTGKAGSRLLKRYGTMTQAAEALKSGEVESAAAPAPAPALPAGWSVRVK